VTFGRVDPRVGFKVEDSPSVVNTSISQAEQRMILRCADRRGGGVNADVG
jgi:hypothetical protein